MTGLKPLQPLTTLGDPNALVCEDGVCAVPWAEDAAPEPAVEEQRPR